MSISVSLGNNSVHSLSIEFMELTPSFKDDIVNHIHTNLDVFTKLKEFGDYYLSLGKKEKKIFDNPEQIWEKENDTQIWCDIFIKNIAPNNLIELINITHSLNIKPLL